MVYNTHTIYKNGEIEKLIKELNGFDEVTSPFTIATGFIQQINKFYINKIIGLAVVELRAYRGSALTNIFATAFNFDKSYNIKSLIGSQYITPLASDGVGIDNCIVVGSVNTNESSPEYGDFIVRKHMGSNNPYGFYATQLYIIGS